MPLIALDRALAEHTPEIHHSDQGIQYAATVYIQMLRAVNAETSMAESGQAWQNGYAERLVQTIIEEEADLSDNEDYNDAILPLGRFLNDVYMRKRSHSSWEYLTPTEFEERRRECEQPSDAHQDRPQECPLWDQEILSNVVDQKFIGGEYPWSGHEQIVGLRLRSEHLGLAVRELDT